MSDTEVRYRLLGEVAALGEDGRPLALGAPKQRTVLAALLLQANRVVAEDRLFALVWGEQPPRSVRGRVQVYISELRALLGQGVIVRAGSGYRLDADPEEIDLHVFQRAVRRAIADARAGRPEAAAEHLRWALALWQGPPLDGVGNALLEYALPGLEEQLLGAREELYEAELAAGRHASVVGELRAMVGEHPFREAFISQLMLALHRCDRRTEALRVYTEAHRRLADELGIEPSQSLRDTQLKILNDEPSRAAPQAALARPATPAELPRDVHAFRGRVKALARLDERMPHGSGGVGVISGPAGVGKTALAVHWARGARRHYPDGQLYLNLRGFEPNEEPLPPTAALGRLLQSLGVAPRNLPEEPDAQAALYRSLLADRRVLLVLDNARDSAQVLPLLPAGGSVLITSRNRLPELVVNAGAELIPLGGLDSDETRQVLEAVLGAERVAVEPDAVARLAELCGGLPLALRIAAAHLAARPEAAIADTVDQLSQGNPLDALVLDGARHSILTAAFAASYDALDPDSQRMFRLLGAVAGPDFTVPTLAALAGVPIGEAMRRLRILVSVHLVEQDVRDRYRCHDLVRAYALERVRRDPELESAWTRLIEHYTSIAAAAADRGGRGRTVRLPPASPISRARVRTDPGADQLAEEFTNIVSALRYAADRGPHPLSWALIEDLLPHFHGLGRHVEWIGVAPVLLAAAERHGEVHMQALLHRGVGVAHFRAGRRDLGIRHIAEALRIARDLGWRECEAAALDDYGTAMEWVGRLAEAAGHSRESARIFAELGSVDGENRALNSLGDKYHHLGRLREAEDCYRQALQLSERHNLPRRKASDLMDLGALQYSLGQHADAEYNLTRALGMFTELDSLMGQIFTRYWLSRLRWENDDARRAYTEALRAVELSKLGDARLTGAATLNALSDAEIRLGRLDDAEGHIKQSIAVVSTGGFGFHLAHAQCALARLRAAQGSYEAALDAAHAAQRTAREGGYKLPEISASLVIAEAHWALGQYEQADAAATETLEMCRETGAANEARRIRQLQARPRR